MPTCDKGRVEWDRASPDMSSLFLYFPQCRSTSLFSPSCRDIRHRLCREDRSHTTLHLLVKYLPITCITCKDNACNQKSVTCITLGATDHVVSAMSSRHPPRRTSMASNLLADRRVPPPGQLNEFLILPFRCRAKLRTMGLHNGFKAFVCLDGEFFSSSLLFDQLQRLYLPVICLSCRWCVIHYRPMQRAIKE